MADEKTAETPAKETDWEKRYKDLQSHNTSVEQKLKITEEEMLKDKQLLQDVSPFVDWEKASGKQEQTDGDDLVVKKDLQTEIAAIKKELQSQRVIQDFRVKYPDMNKYEDLVTLYVGKTDARKAPNARIEEAVVLARNFLETERTKGKADNAETIKEKIAKEAEASGFESSSHSSEKKKDEDGETYDDYIKSRKTNYASARNI